MASRAGVNGAAIGLIAAGVVLAYSGIKNATAADTIRALIKGQPVQGSSSGSFIESLVTIKGQLAEGAAGNEGGPGVGGQVGGAIAGGQLNAAILAAVAKYKGVPYVLGGASRRGVDCSGLVTLALRDVGLNLPSNTHTVTGQFYAWDGAVTVPWAQMMPGDLVCWPGHIGIAASSPDAKGNATMWDAPHTGSKVQVQRIWKIPPPIARRVKPQ